MREIKVGNELAFQYYHRLQEIKRFIEEHYMEEISLKKAARVAGLEKNIFGISNFIGTRAAFEALVR